MGVCSHITKNIVTHLSLVVSSHADSFGFMPLFQDSYLYVSAPYLSTLEVNGTVFLVLTALKNYIQKMKSNISHLTVSLVALDNPQTLL